MDKILRWIAKRLPRGGFRITRFLAKHNKSLQHYPVQLKLLPSVTFIGDLRDGVFHSLFQWGCYPHQLGEDLITRAILRPGDIVYDIGANIGYNAVLYGHVVQKTGHVYAFEPCHTCLNYLQENVKLWDNITIVPKAASDSIGEVTFVQRKNIDSSRIIWEEEEAKQIVPKGLIRTIETTTIDQFYKASSTSPRGL